MVVGAGVFGFSACASNTGADVATIKNQSSVKPSAQSSAVSGGELTEQERANKFTSCLRAQGLDVKDIDLNNPRIDLGGSDQAVVKKAMDACQSFLPNNGKPPAGAEEALKKTFLAYAKCMRENGIPDFKDPVDSSSFTLPEGLTPDDPRMVKANDVCKKILAEGMSSIR